MRGLGIEPSSQVLQTCAEMTTLAHLAMIHLLVPRDRIELPSAPCKDAALPLDERGIGAKDQTCTG